MTLSPYYRLLLLTSGLVLGASPAQATQPFSPLNMLADGDSTELLVSPSPELNFPGPTSESEALGPSFPEEIGTSVATTTSAIEVLPPETIDTEVGAGNLDAEVEALALMASTESVKSAKDTASPPAIAQGEQGDVTTTVRATSQIDKSGSE
ncbi:hypothetical protein IQ225_12850, partial [Synechocystis salina LEGE 06155]|nr:hypothetical protein [Synechocystis salina LEGE 06155]